MALKTLLELQNEIDQAVHTNGPQGKTRAAGLNTVLKSLASELTTQQQETAQALAGKTDLLGKNNTWIGTNYFGKGIRFYGNNGFDEYGKLFINHLDLANKQSWNDRTYTLAKDSAIVWKPTDYTAQQGAPDVGLARADAGILEVNTGTPGNPATLTTLDVVALAAPPALNSVTKLAAALPHKADLDAGGRVPSSQLPSYVDDIVEAIDFATLPLPGEAGKVYVTLDTNKQYRWAGTAYALLSDSGLTATVKAGLEAATNPSTSNAFATLADLAMGNDAKATLTTTGRKRVPYFGTGTVSDTNEDGLKKALAAAQPGDTVQQLSLAKIAAPYRTGEQIRIPAGVNYDTGGFDIDATGYCDGIILVGGTGVIHGGNATISHNVNGSWGIGWYGGGALDYRIYNLNIHTAVDGQESFANPFAIYLHECRVYHTGSIVSATPTAILNHNIAGVVGNQYEHVGTVTGLGNGQLFAAGTNGRIIQRGDVVVAENAKAGTIYANAILTMHGGTLDLRSAQPDAGFKLDPAGILNLIDVTVLGNQMPALLIAATQGSGATVHLYGDTVLPDLPWPAGITVVDHRPVSTGTGNTPNLTKADLVNGTVPGNQLPTDATSPIYISNRGALDVRRGLGLAFDSDSSALGVNFTNDLATAQDDQVPTATALRIALAKAGSTVKTEPVVGDNLLDLTDPDILVDYYINENYIGNPTNVAGWTSSGFIPVTPGKTYAANNNITHSAWFDASKQFLAGYGSTTSVAPVNAAYLRVSIQTSAFKSLMLVLGASNKVPATYQKFWKLLVNSTPKPFSGKKIGLVGDSLTLQGLYINSLVAELDAVGYVQQGFSGEVFRSGITMLPANAFAGCALIQVMFGTNEYGHGGNTLGTTSDSSSANTICGVVRYAYEVLHAQYPTAIICFVTPTERGAFAGEPTSPAPNPYGLTIKLIGEAIKAVCRSLDTPFVDLYESSNINSLTFAQTLQSDNLHWSSLGAAYVGKVIGKTINKLLS
jgi:hypothetical protein